MSTALPWYTLDVVFSDTVKTQTGAKTPVEKSFFVAGAADIFRSNRSSLCFCLHVSSRSAAVFAGCLFAFGIVAEECGKCNLGAWRAADFALVIIKIQCHARISDDYGINVDNSQAIAMQDYVGLPDIVFIPE